MYEEIEINENEETMELATCEEPAEENSGIGLKGVLAGVALVGAAVWGVKKLSDKLGLKEKRSARKLQKAEEELKNAGYIVKKLDPNILDIPVVEENDKEETDE